MSESLPPRIRLLQAAHRLAGEGGAPPDAARIAAAAGMPPSAVDAHFGGFDALQCELLALLYDEVRDLVAKLTLNMPAGRVRLQLAIDTYLQALLDRPALAALTRRLRFHPRGAAILRQRVTGFSLMFQLELKAMGWPFAPQTARLCTAALIETATAEAAAGRRLPELRAALLGYFDPARAA
ncbi:hypothetical protein [Solimonas flava]|uniref:hypothetical protein n=1 Tax=Solimonas flava TaxID=415849 RepID=UPI0012B57475|nr:hypothetical protein [Solimonas flava]